jgi:hypothetical protein
MYRNKFKVTDIIQYIIRITLSNMSFNTAYLFSDLGKFYFDPSDSSEPLMNRSCSVAVSTPIWET